MSSPFDSRKYQRLLEGLEAVEVSLKVIEEEKTFLRIDSEHFKKDAILTLQKISQSRHKLLSSIVDKILHPTEIVREYEDDGIQILLAQNVRDNYFDFSNSVFMHPTKAEILANNIIEQGDIVMTRSGANFGQSAAWKESSKQIYACADVLVLKQSKIPNGYVSTFFNTKYGWSLIDRGSYGMAQPHIAPSYLNTLKIPFWESLAAEIDTLVITADLRLKESGEIYTQAERTLLTELGLRDWQPPQPLTYQRRASEAFQSGRWDAQYFSPRVQSLLEILHRDKLTIGKVAKLRKEYFDPSHSATFQYIEISDVSSSGEVESSLVDSNATPDRATWYVRTGDVITSTVRPIRRLSALIQSKQDGFVCSSGFAVLQPREVPTELLLVYLRLPVIAELMDLHTTASMYPAISILDILNIPFLQPSVNVTQQVVQAVRDSHTARRTAKTLLDRAKRAVEIAIEESERAALAFLAAAGSD